MNFYSLEYSASNLIGNGDCQARCLSNDDIVRSFIRQPFPIVPEILQFELRFKAELTNCLSQYAIASGGLLIDERFKKILESYVLMKHKFYSVVLFDQTGVINGNYFWMQIKESFTDEIDYVNSDFYETNLATRGPQINFSSFSDYEAQRNQKGWEWNSKAKEIVIIPNSKLLNMDLFTLWPFDNRICISEKLKNSLQQNKITGIEIKKYEKIRFFGQT